MTRPMPPGRWLKSSRQAWEAWGRSEAAKVWDDARWLAAERLLRLTDDLARADDPVERRRLAVPVRTAERDLGLLHRVKPPDNTKDPHARTRTRNKYLRSHTDPRWWVYRHGIVNYGAAGAAFDAALGDVDEADRLLGWTDEDTEVHSKQRAEAERHPGGPPGTPDPRLALVNEA